MHAAKWSPCPSRLGWWDGGRPGAVVGLVLLHDHHGAEEGKEGYTVKVASVSSVEELPPPQCLQRLPSRPSLFDFAVVEV